MATIARLILVPTLAAPMLVPGYTRRFPMLRRVLSLLALLLLSCSADGGDAIAITEAPLTLGQLLVVDHVAIYQGVKVTLVDQTVAAAKPNAPVVPGRPAYVRVHARAAVPRAELPELTAQLRVRVPGREDVVVTDGPKPVLPYDDAAVASSFNFDLAAEQVAPDATFEVDFADASGGAFSLPPSPLHVGPLAPTLKVRFVPVRYEADGSSRLPPVDEATLASYRDALYKLYPVAGVDLSVRAPIVWRSEVAANGDGWDALLGAIIETRADDVAADDVYYVGIFNPAETERLYCAKGCVLGVAPAAYEGEPRLRVATVLGYPGDRTRGTLAQEIAHAMGRFHAPCGKPAAVDLQYPYPDASIGTWGFDVLERTLITPQQKVHDFMSYCNPVWVSDYTFAALYEHMVVVERTKRAPSRMAQTVAQAGLGALEFRPVFRRSP